MPLSSSASITGVPRRHHVADDDDVRPRLQLRGVEAFDELDAERVELLAHRGIDILDPSR